MGGGMGVMDWIYLAQEEYQGRAVMEMWITFWVVGKCACCKTDPAQYNIKFIFIPEEATKAQKGSRFITLLFL